MSTGTTAAAGGEGRGIADRVLVAGARVAGTACAEVLLDRGAHVTVYDRADSERLRSLAERGATCVVADAFDPALLEGVDQVVLSPGFPPHHPIAVAAREAGLEAFSEPELAWRLREPGAARWLAVTGTNGKTTTTTMLAEILQTAGLRTAALGNIGVPLVHAANGPYDVISVELSSYQLHWSSTLAPTAGAVLNLAPDHLDWHGGFDAYAEAKAAVWRGGRAVVNLDDPAVVALAKRTDAEVIGFTLNQPEPGQFGVALGFLVDYTGDAPVQICSVGDVRPAGWHNVANALAAAALARQAGVAHRDIGEAIRDYTPEPHRNVTILRAGEVTWVDDSKATNPHAAAAALAAYDSIVWVAGGQLKGVDVDGLAARFATKMRAAVLIGQDRAQLADALARHAPDLPVVVLDGGDDAVMTDVAARAAGFARPGDTVLLSPAAASYDMFDSYAHRGNAFAAAARALVGEAE
ncbi:UDP-N-acetylmuramoyl-L-alanine--D-glutamate ligase [Glycomyces harbinensis]|uniref:UDP-N-acetylmuramoylalanine--D-glutamate ligase n=1 Tax=Glycomyces harbinensis TaxID=58114 RepID=A0A1G6SQV9_9ACTN|nr:UDP-N-acetylmuramoyl-L-alanine--D-glutamate ligase [Glycomyces harbinensis]SDD19074.1 UDP-N-acetylmuramoylalanine--D-glutamate ligase [Glycomyces harbinensis]